MKRMLLLIVLSLILCLLPGCSSPPESKEQLTVELGRQLAEKGEGRTWDDLAPYEYDSEAGSGRVVRFYIVEPSYLLLVSGDTAEEKPQTARFVHNRNSEQYIDIRTDDVDAFLEENPPLESQP